MQQLPGLHFIWKTLKPFQGKCIAEKTQIKNDQGLSTQLFNVDFFSLLTVWEMSELNLENRHIFSSGSLHLWVWIHQFVSVCVFSHERKDYAVVSVCLKFQSVCDMWILEVQKNYKKTFIFKKHDTIFTHFSHFIQ